MGKINRIQLRGISRTPSDRMNSDGGVAESLNMYIDEAESASALLPKDVTSELGLPDNLVADKVFIHKGNNYENAIVVQGSALKAYVNGDDREMALLNKGESVSDIVAVGNTLVATTQSRLLYILYINNEYRYLGDGIPVPQIEFQSISNYDLKAESKEYRLTRTEDLSGAINPINIFNEETWNKAIKDRESGTTTEYTNRLTEIEEGLWADIKKEVNRYRSIGRFCAPFLVRFAVRLYDGSYINHSVPILLGSGYDKFVSVEGRKIVTASLLHSYIQYTLDNIFDVTAFLKNWDAEGWEDIIESVDIFASTDVCFPALNSQFKELSLSQSTEGSVSTFYYSMPFRHGSADEFTAMEEELVSKGLFYKIGSFPLNDDRLQKGWKLASAENMKSLTDLALTEERLDDSLVQDEVTPGNLLNYNNRLLATDASVYASRGYSFLNGTNIAIGNKVEAVSKPYLIKYYIRGAKETEVLGEYFDGTNEFYAYEMNTSDQGGAAKLQANIYGFMAHPDPNCYKVEIWTSGGEVCQRTMKAHPRLNCSYAFWGLANTIGLGENVGNDVSREDFLREDRRKVHESKVYAYDVNNPFLIGQSLTFQSRVLGVAIASTALSQGQFGQFPLYVFTEDGIWAMETAADGSFVTSKPLSRDVCVNPDSITSIDNAVVFVTDKGVMLLQGSQVVSISPHMNGKHYTIEESAKVIVNGQEDFKDLIPVVKDDTHFMAFVKDATIAYDYPGKRLIFIKKAEAYQYIYKLDTSTWHKTAYGIDMVAPINSYPDALVQTEAENLIRLKLYIEEAYRYDDQTFDLFYGEVAYLKILSEEQWGEMFFGGKNIIVTVTEEKKAEIDEAREAAETHAKVSLTYDEQGKVSSTRIYNLSTPLDVESQTPTKGIIVTRPFDLDAPDELKSITDLRIRGQYARGAVKYILLGSMDGHNFHVINTKRGKSWKLFRLIILADLKPTERISWVDVEFEQRLNNRLR